MTPHDGHVARMTLDDALELQRQLEYPEPFQPDGETETPIAAAALMLLRRDPVAFVAAIERVECYGIFWTNGGERAFKRTGS